MPTNTLRINLSRFGANEIMPYPELTALFSKLVFSGSPKLYWSDPEKIACLSELSFLICTMEITTLYGVVVKITRDKVGFDEWKPMLSRRLHVPGVVLYTLHILTDVIILGRGTLRSEGEEVVQAHRYQAPYRQSRSVHLRCKTLTHNQ